MITYQLTKSDKDLEEILELQKKNLPDNISVSEKKKEGFVTVKHNLALLKKMHKVLPHSIAKYNDKVISYALSMDKINQDDIPVLKPMFKEIETVFFKNYIVMGQICIDKNFRGKGVFKNIYSFMAKTFSAKYNAIITEIDYKNTRSINAHKSVGFKEIKRYSANNQDWSIVKLDI